MISTLTKLLIKNKEPHLLIVLLIWAFIGLEAHLWWYTRFYGAAVFTALVGYSMLFYVLPGLTSRIDRHV